MGKAKKNCYYIRNWNSTRGLWPQFRHLFLTANQW